MNSSKRPKNGDSGSAGLHHPNAQPQLSIDQMELKFEKIPKLNKRAPVQISFENKAALQRMLPNVGDASVYNIWYDKWYSEDKTKYGGISNPDKIPFTKCDPESQSGLTRANNKSISADPLFCVFFARGCCGKGFECRYLHRVPTMEDEKHIEKTRDCFGRERHKTDREDMMGVGSFERECRTIYVGRIGRYPRQNYEKIVRKQFSKFGDIQKIRINFSRSCAFIKYTCRLNAEFAKEAMHEQSLELGEVLAIKWAYDEPDDTDKKQDTLQVQKQFIQSLLENKTSGEVQSYLRENLGGQLGGKKEEDLINEWYNKQAESSDGTTYSDFLGKKLEDAAVTSGIVKRTKADTEHDLIQPPPPPPKKKPKKDSSVDSSEVPPPPPPPKKK